MSRLPLSDVLFSRQPALHAARATVGASLMGADAAVEIMFTAVQ